MADRLSAEQRSRNMSHCRGKDTSIEIKVRKYLFHHGFRYRKNVKGLPGVPDIVLPKYRTVIFVHGCFWHRHPNCKKASMPATRVDFWQEKFQKNVLNDERHNEELQKLGWNVIVIWECEIKQDFETIMQRVVNDLNANYLSQYIEEN